MNWHACGKGFDIEKMALNLKMAYNFSKKKKNLKITHFTCFFYVLLPIILLKLNDWLGKNDEFSGLCWLKFHCCKNDETSWGAALLWQVQPMIRDYNEKGPFS